MLLPILQQESNAVIMNNGNVVSGPKRDRVCRTYNSTRCGFGCLGYIPPHKNIFQTAFYRLMSKKAVAVSYRWVSMVTVLASYNSAAIKQAGPRNRFQYHTGILRTDQQGNVLHDRLTHYYFVNIMSKFEG